MLFEDMLEVLKMSNEETPIDKFRNYCMMVAQSRNPGSGHFAIASAILELALQVDYAVKTLADVTINVRTDASGG